MNTFQLESAKNLFDVLPKITKQHLSSSFDSNFAKGTYGPGEEEYWVGIDFHNNGQNKDAVEAMEKALKIGLTGVLKAVAHSTCAENLVDLVQRFPDAVDHFLKCLQITPKSPSTTFQAALRLSYFYDAAGRGSEASSLEQLADVANNALPYRVRLDDSVAIRYGKFAKQYSDKLASGENSPSHWNNQDSIKESTSTGSLGDLLSARCVSNSPWRVDLEFERGTIEGYSRYQFTFGYAGAGSRKFYNFLHEAGLNVSEDQVYQAQEGDVFSTKLGAAVNPSSGSGERERQKENSEPKVDSIENEDKVQTQELRQTTISKKRWQFWKSTPAKETDFPSVKIGNQVYMTGNLNVDKFRNGDPIPEAKTDSEWEKAGEKKQPAWCYYKNDEKNGKIYGRLYNWYAVNDLRGLAPEGWNIPSDDEWTILTTHLGGDGSAGGKMKSTGSHYWKSPNKDASNSSGFSGLPGGGCFENGKFSHIGDDGDWWSSSESGTYTAWFRGLNSGYGKVYRRDPY